MAGTTKIKAVLTRSQLGYTAFSNYIPFELTDEKGVVIRTLIMSRKEVNDLGWPDQITVTVEPGVQLTVGGR